MANKKVRMLVQISGTRDGEDWPAAGQEITVSEDEAKQLIASGQAAEPNAPEENALADALGVSTATVDKGDGQASIRQQLKPAPHADEPQAFHVPVLPGEEAAAEEGQKNVDEANKDLGIDVAANEAIRKDEDPADAAPATNKRSRKA